MIELLNIDCMSNEQWKEIPDFEHYLISSHGRVFNTRTGMIKKSAHDYKGYRRVRLIDGRKRGATKKIHRLVAQAFVASYSDSLQVNHKNCKKDDNVVDNLEMVTQSQNTKHAWENGRMKLSARDKTGKFCRSIERFDKETRQIDMFQKTVLSK